MHCGNPAQLCATCLEEAFAKQRTAARTRGQVWADDIAATVSGMDWPLHSEVLIAIARLKVVGLGWDPRLIDRLAHEALDAAFERWKSHRGLRAPDGTRASHSQRSPKSPASEDDQS